MPTIRLGEDFTVDQILNCEGFTLDTSDFPDLLYDDEPYDHQRTVELSNQEIQRLMNLEDETEYSENAAAENTLFIGIGFDTLKPRMNSIFGNGEVLKLIKKEGTGGVVPPVAQVTLEYNGYFEYQDEPFDSTLFQRGKRAILQLGTGGIIKGLEIAIASMSKYEKAVFIIQPNLAYGGLGCPPRIPEKAEVLFKVELIDFLDNGSADKYDELTDEDKRKFPAIEKIVRHLLNATNNSHKRQKVQQAIREYSRAVCYLENAQLKNDEEEASMNKQLSRCLLNLMMCYNQMGQPKLACDSFDRLPTKTAKAFYQYGKALKQLGEYDKAMKALQTANNESPNDDAICEQIKQVEDKRKTFQENAKRFAQKSLKLADDKTDEFEACAREICECFKDNSSVLRQKFSGLTQDEINCITRVAASYGFSITTEVTFGITKMFLYKKEYFSRNFK